MGMISTEELLAALPPRQMLLEGDMEARTRSVLHLLLEEGVTQPEVIPVDPTTCPNCDTRVPSTRTPYCGECCKETSALIRQLRSGFLTGSLLLPDKQVPLGQKLWRNLGGGLPARVALVEGRTLARIIEKKGSRCELCGAPATLVDNIGGG